MGSSLLERNATGFVLEKLYMLEIAELRRRWIGSEREEAAIGGKWLSITPGGAFPAVNIYGKISRGNSYYFSYCFMHKTDVEDL